MGKSKSKKNKVVHLTKTKKKDRSFKELLVQKIQSQFDKYENLFIFSHENMRTNPFRDIQAQLSDSKFFLGKNKVMQIALGKTDNDEFKPNLHKISENLINDCGILFTNRSMEEIKRFFDEYRTPEYSKVGQIAPQTIILEKNSSVFSKFSHSLEPYLRKLGLNTSLVNTEIHLNQNYVLAEKDKQLNPEQCKILKLLKIQLTEFQINLIGMWNKSGSYKTIF